MSRSLLACSLALTALLASPAGAQSRVSRDQAERTARRDATVRVVAEAGPAVANVSIRERTPHPHVVNGKTTPASTLRHGSAVVIDPAGFLLTNAHVLAPGAVIQVSLPGRGELKARVIALLPEVDLALLKVDPQGKPLPTVRLAKPGDVLIGETCIAIGNPFGLGNSVTRGVISAKGRRLKHKGRALLGGFLQTDAAINPGNSGGALMNVDGELIGINTAIHAGGQGIGFAIPPGRIRESLARLSDPLALRGRWLGWRLTDTAEGVRVTRVTRDGPAARAGVKRGDLITAAGPRPVDSSFAVQRAFLGKRLAAVRLSLQRDGRRRGASLTPAAPPWRTAIRRRLGVRSQSLTPTLAWWLGIKAPRGVLVRRVDPGTPAAALGLRRGDLLTRIARRDGKRMVVAPLANGRSLERFLRRAASGQPVLVELIRGGARQVGKLRLR